MKNLSVQKEYGWCNVHTLCNVLRDEDFKVYIGKEKYKSGDFNSVNSMLKDAGYLTYTTFPIMCISNYFPSIPDDYLDSIISCSTEDGDIDMELPIFPYFLTVSNNGKDWHSVAVIRCGDSYLYTDPLNEDMILLDKISDIHNHFNKCNGIERIQAKCDDGIDKFIVLDGEDYGYEEIFKRKTKINLQN